MEKQHNKLLVMNKISKYLIATLLIGTVIYRSVSQKPEIRIEPVRLVHLSYLSIPGLAAQGGVVLTSHTLKDWKVFMETLQEQPIQKQLSLSLHTLNG